MGRVLDQSVAAKATNDSKDRRWKTTQTLFGIHTLDELFPEGSVPNDGGTDYRKVSGDVLRDINMIGGELLGTGLTQEQVRARLQKSFTAGVPARHADIRDLLARVKANNLKSVDTMVQDPVSAISARLVAENEQATTNTFPIAAAMSSYDPQQSEYAPRRAKIKASAEIANMSGQQDSEGEVICDSSDEATQDEVLKNKANSLEIESSDEQGAFAMSQIRLREAATAVGVETQQGNFAGPRRGYSSLRPIAQDGFADLYDRSVHTTGISKRQIPFKSDVHPTKKIRTIESTAPISAAEAENEILISCMRITLALLEDVVEQNVAMGDSSDASSKLTTITDMLGHVLTKYG